MTAKIGQSVHHEAAFANAARNRAGYRWPTRTEVDRLDPIYDPILVPRFALAPGAKVFAIGGSFARKIEARLQRIGFEVPMPSRAAGPADYGDSISAIDRSTPSAALQEVERALQTMRSPDRADEILDEGLYPVSDGIVIDLELPGYLPVRRERALQRRRPIVELFQQAFNADCVVIALGAVESWFDQKTGRGIQDVPHPALLRAEKDRFVLRVLDVVEVVWVLDALVRHLLEHGRRDKKILAAVCPLPLAATFSGSDIVIANCYNKATLRTAFQIVADRHDRVDYFPAYEMATASLGAGIWEDDLLHVSEAFASRLIEVFEKYYVSGTADAGARPKQDVMALTGPFRAEGRYGWSLALPEDLAALADNFSNDRSPLVLIEDARELGPVHAEHDEIRNVGGGAHSFWANQLYFSTSDGSDPNTNGREYRVVRTD